MNLNFANATRSIIAKKVKIREDYEREIKEDTIREYNNLGFYNIPELMLSLVVLKRLKVCGIAEGGEVLYLTRNFNSDEFRFLHENHISYYFGDLEVFDSEYYIEDFSSMLYFVEYDIEKSLIYARVMRFAIVDQSNKVEEVYMC